MLTFTQVPGLVEGTHLSGPISTTWNPGFFLGDLKLHTSPSHGEREARSMLRGKVPNVPALHPHPTSPRTWFWTVPRMSGHLGPSLWSISSHLEWRETTSGGQAAQCSLLGGVTHLSTPSPWPSGRFGGFQMLLDQALLKAYLIYLLMYAISGIVSIILSKPKNVWENVRALFFFFPNCFSDSLDGN